jgi:hypothetical protein
MKIHSLIRLFSVCAGATLAFSVTDRPNTLAQDPLHAQSIDICENPHAIDSHVIDCSGKNVTLEDFEKMNQIKSATYISFRFSKSSDWDQLSRLNLPRLEYIAFRKTDMVVFPNISHMSSMTTLELVENDIKEIKSDLLPGNLQKITLILSLFNDLDFIQGVPSLNILDIMIHKSKSLDIQGISYATKLEVFNLNFGVNPEVKVDISSLVGLKHLKGLGVSLKEVMDVSPIRHLTSLEVLSLGDGFLDDFSILQPLMMIKSLSMSKLAMDDLEAIQHLEFMEMLHVLNGASLKSLHGIEKMRGLRDLRIERLKGADLSLIAELDQLEVLTLSGDILPDLSFLSGLKDLKKINLASDNLSDVTALLGCENLEEISINGTKIIDINPLIGLKRLKVIYADRAPISWETTDPALMEKVYRDKVLP